MTAGVLNTQKTLPIKALRVSSAVAPSTGISSVKRVSVQTTTKILVKVLPFGLGSGPLMTNMDHCEKGCDGLGTDCVGVRCVPTERIGPHTLQAAVKSLQSRFNPGH
jgi:hypothetical protein